MCQHPSNHPASRPSGDGGLKVPFGLRDGKLMRPEQVQSGMACGCLCPGCAAPLVAKAGSSQLRRPHFAHLADADCRTGYETALHLKAKALIADHAQLWLPAWDGDAGMANPPILHDDDGKPVMGRKIDFPARETALTEVGLEVRCGDYIPDILASDEFGELLIEIRVSHAVDEVKRRWIQSEGRRLIEIDLSRLDHDIVSNEDALVHAVLRDPARRKWLSCPEATDAWREAFRELKGELARRNAELASKRAAFAASMREQHASLARRMAEEEARKANRERFREQERAPYLQALEVLPGLVSLDRIETLLEAYEKRDRKAIVQLAEGIPDATIRSEVQLPVPNGWIYTVHPSYWQSAVYHYFVLDRSMGGQFNQRDVARWVMQRFGKEESLYALFRAQYAFRSRARAAGIHKRAISFWAFTEMENRQIPEFYRPINNFIDRLIYLGVLERVPEILGEVRVI